MQVISVLLLKVSELELRSNSRTRSFFLALTLFFLSSIDCCFSVQIIKNERGLGISVYGGIDINVPYRGLIRIKRLFPNQPAWSTGMLQPGDILLEANEIPLTGLTNHVIFY